MAVVSAELSIFKNLVADLMRPSPTGPGMSAADAQAFMNSLVAEINLSPTLQGEILDLNSKGWTLSADGTNIAANAAETVLNIKQIRISAVATNPFYDAVISGGKAAGAWIDNVSEFVGSLAHEAGHAEDPENNTIGFFGNGLAPGAETAEELLSEGKAEYNNIKVAEEIYTASNGKTSISVRGNQTGINSQIADAGIDPAKTIIDGAKSFLLNTTSTNNENYISYYWDAALSHYATNIVSSVQSLLTSMDVTKTSALDLAQNANGTDTMTLWFAANTSNIISYSDTFAGYGTLAASGTAGGQGSVASRSPSGSNVMTDQVFNLSNGTSVVDYYNAAAGLAENIVTYSGAGGEGLATQIDVPDIGLATAATIVGSTLRITEASGTTISIGLDPAQNYTGHAYNISGDANQGSNFTLITKPSTYLKFAVFDTTTSTEMDSAGTPYTGPVVGIADQYLWLGTDNVNITAQSPNTFIHAGPGMDAINVAGIGGNNILDGGPGSNFLTGGTGRDEFYVDARSLTATVWSTVANFHSGDDASIWGLDASDFTVTWLDGQGAAGYTGITGVFRSSTPATPLAAITLAGYTSADLTNGKLVLSFGRTTDVPGVPGSNYLSIHAA